MSEASKKILAFYDRHIKEHGAGPLAVGWNDKKSQEARFAALCKVGDLEGASVLDVGCGFGDLYGYLKDHYEGIEYTGIDINPQYIEHARLQRCSNCGQAKELHPDAHFEVADFEGYEGGPARNASPARQPSGSLGGGRSDAGGQFDYVCASGTFAVKIPNYKEIYFRQIEKMFNLARKGIAFTMLDEKEHPNDEEYAAYSVEEVQEFCRSLADDVVVYHDYLPHDFTVIIKKKIVRLRGVMCASG